MPVGKDVQFGLDDFQRPMAKDKNHAIAQSVLNILLMRKGQLPSMPHIGLDLYSYMYKFEDEIDVGYILGEVQAQCSELANYINTDAIEVMVLPIDGVDTLVIAVPVYGESNIIYGFRKKDDVLLFNYEFDTSSII